LADALKKERGSLYVHVCDGSDVVSTELLLLSSDAIYSFLGGTIATHFDKRPNDLLKHEVIKWGKAHSFKYYVLGGGAAPEDGIYRYKRSFEPDGIYPFYIRKIVHNKSIYEELLKYRDKYERAKGGNWVPRENFFPLYLS
jgi:hypothetical protein